MAIRSKNLDLKAKQNKEHTHTVHGDITATKMFPIFVAPYSCKVDFVEVYSMGNFSPSTSNTLRFSARVGSASTSLLFNQVHAVTAVSSVISANVGFRIVPTANNSLTAGTVILADISCVCNVTLSQVMIMTQYSKLLHRYDV